ncbi:MAG: YbjN domain-containing protein [Deltaproteobacteria bacterium]|jgi:hypothetical protein|nr:YbjN domain-containing protein [Deltaproteobacteria bacterium]
MKSRFFPLQLLALASALSLLVAFPSVSGADSCTSVENMDIPALADLMKSMDLSAEVMQNDDAQFVRWTLDRRNAVLRMSPTGKTIILLIWSSGLEATSQQLETWNREQLFGKSYLDKDGDPTLELYVELAGGICEERLRDFFTTCQYAIDLWFTKLSEQSKL